DQGYTPADLNQAPADAAEISLGCGNPLAMALLKEGDTVIDIGSGGGIDAFIAARKVGPAGRVIGVDMTPSMLRRARQSALKAGFRNVQFREGHAEDLPVAGDSADMVISNCVINLAVDKGRVFAEAFRVLKPGGRLEVSDMVTSGPLPARLRQDPQNWAGCVYGALPEQEYLDLVKEAGFKDVRTQRSGSAGALDGTDIYSLQVSAIKPEDTHCCDSGCCCG
ncbi:MAG TPA: arsenite methyltransferase, partial [Anaerolineaceae bacterium]|nr:arsenite methyltransferase [Anaerolineaceae bacterium]